ncbi:MAG: Na(+)/H(+) antiporter subunit B [Thermodesulfobacteriota bacterium]|nr:MAG: Na(+)/H(+) antiporter subunit B [Thermodesulfobacteriota bacterium]
MKEHVVSKTVAKLLIPFIQLYALYVLAHGENGPGGGFQAGVIFGAALILYVICFGIDEGRRRFSEKTGDILKSLGVLIFAGIGIACLWAGGAYLEYAALPLGAPKLASHLGIFGIEIGVGIAVAGVMITIFFETARKDEDD